jgi:hypothetical protein
MTSASAAQVKLFSDDQIAKFDQAKQSITDVDNALAGMVQGGHAQEAAAATMKLYDAWTAAGGTAEEFKKKFPEAVTALEGYSKTSTTVVDDTGQMTDAMGKATSAADILKAAFDALNGKTLTLDEAHIRWTQTLEGVKVAADKGSTSLDLNTLAGSQNAQQFVDAAQRASEFAQAVGDTQGVDAGRAALEQMKQSLIDHAAQAGFDRQAVGNLIDSLFQVPKDTPTALTLHDGASAGIAQVNGALDRINGKTASTYIVNTVVNKTVEQLIHATPIYETGSGGNPIGLPPVRAAGGPVWENQTFLVGERGPELVQFGATGFVTPSDVSRRALAAAAPAASMAGAPAAFAIDYGRLGAAVAAALANRPVVAIGNYNTTPEQGPYELAEALNWQAAGRG